jgi:hypothetical protein
VKVIRSLSGELLACNNVENKQKALGQGLLGLYSSIAKLIVPARPLSGCDVDTGFVAFSRISLTTFLGVV